MIQGVFKFFLVVAGFLTIITYWFSLGSLGAIFAAFGGMFLGWSLQGPISGLAAWLLVSIIRPFSARANLFRAVDRRKRAELFLNQLRDRLP